MDKERVRLADYKAKDSVKLRRKKRKRVKAKKQDGFVRSEGVTYKSQSFYEASTSSSTRKGTKRKARSKKANVPAKKAKKN